MVSSSTVPAPGVRVTISVGARVITPGQDTSVTVRLDNVSTQPVELVGLGNTYFNVTVTDSSGKLVSYSWSNKPQSGYRGLLLQTTRLAAGAHLAEDEDVRFPSAGTFLLRAQLLQPSENPVFSYGTLPSLSLTATPAATPATVSVAPDALGILRGQGARVVASAEPAKSGAAAAIKTAEAQSAVDSATVVTVTEARVTDGGIVRNRLVWVVGLASVTVHWHGPPPHTGVHPGREAVVIDANTGAWIETAATSSP